MKEKCRDQSFWVRLDFQTQTGGIWLLPFVWHCWGTSAEVCLFWGSLLWDTWVYWSKGSPRHAEIRAYMHKRRMRKPGLFSLEEKMLTYISLLPVADKWEAEKKSARLFSELHYTGIRGNRHILEYGKYQLNINKTIFSMRVLKYWSHKGCRISVCGES